MSGESWADVSDVTNDWDSGFGYVSARYVDNGYVRGFEREEPNWSDASDASTSWVPV